MVVEWLLNVLSQPPIMEATIGDQLCWEMGNVSGSSFCLRVGSICQVMLSPNGSEHVLSSCGAQNDPKEHLELGHCIDEPIVHDDKSLGRRSGRMRLLSRCAEYLFSNSDTVSEYVLSSCCSDKVCVGLPLISSLGFIGYRLMARWSFCGGCGVVSGHYIYEDNNGDRDEDDDSKNKYYRVFDYCFSDLPKIFMDVTIFFIFGGLIIGNAAIYGFCLPVMSICQVRLSPNGSEHVLSSCGAQNAAKEHLKLGHCIDEPIVHDDKSLGRRSGRMSFSDFHGILHELYD
ncbi:hypothetical protein RHSIM_Rhsim10G0082800 [Rhododendron simsii]|uniref:Uncharacterized protein n=1 Tax=Rhododendron simsii TaxID=118357 RepID=A0A834LE90_RHOSS|nr:hypothetical protein RHSIM_Rhsim10G0082800 [Rhododendron simsii]